VSTNETLAQLSNQLVYASMVAYAVSTVAFAASLAATKGRDLTQASAPVSRRSARAAEKAAEAAASAEGAGSVLVATRADAGIGGPDGEAVMAPGRRAGNIAISVMWLATLLLGAGVLLRGLSVMRAPWGNMYEFSIAAAFAVALTYLLIALRRDVRWLGIFVVIPVLLSLGLAVTVLYTEAAQLVPALKSYWLVIHVAIAIICGASFCIAAALSTLYLISEKAERRAAEDRPYWGTGLAKRLPESTKLDGMAYRTIAFMFPLWTFAIVAGAIWAENAWGRYWGWDPKETWAFITWVGYAAYLHARSTAGWKGRKAAYISLVAFAAFLFNYFGVNIFFSGLHSYGGV
jgi:cytochrome c-type biogenesis protein CcsB